MLLVPSLFVLVLLLSTITGGHQLFYYFNGNLLLLNCLNDFSANHLDRECTNYIGSPSQKSTLFRLYTLEAWNNKNYQEFASGCKEAGCLCSSNAPLSSKEALYSKLQNYYSVLSYRIRAGQFPELDTCRDDFVPSSYIWFQSIDTQDQKSVSMLRELAYLTDRDWHDMWPRGYTAFKQAEQYYQAGKHEDAQKAYEITIESLLQSDDERTPAYVSWSHYHLGELALLGGDLEAAEQHFRASILTSSDNGWESFQGLDNVWRSRGWTVEEIIPAFDDIRASTNMSDPYMTSGPALALLARGELDAAWYIIRSAPQDVQEQVPVLVVQGQLYETTNELENAKLAFETALNKIPDNEPLLLASLADQLAQVYMLQDDFPQAISNLELATHFNPEGAWYWYHLGEAYERNTDFEKARVAFEKAMSLAPENATFREALDDLQD